MTIAGILEAIRFGRIRVTDHADEEAWNDNLTVDLIVSSVERGEIIEEYPDDVPYPSCLILSRTADGSPIHTVWAYNPDNDWVVLVTVYRPDPARWVEWRQRRKSE